jgi:uncharacterized repeat protein (TIGR03803 family)
VIYSFTGGLDGALPYGRLARDRIGNLYGTTLNGGTYDYGTVFQLTPNGTETVLHSFAGGVDGQYPYAGLVRDRQGHLYGTTISGGTYDWGTAYEIVP